MKIKILNKKENKMSFLLQNSSPAYCNTLRRVMLSEVPTMAIEEVEFRNNSSALYDEIIAHRLGQLVLTTDLKTYNLKSECKCKGEGCAKCSAILTLKEKGPKTVYASDIKSKDPEIKPVYPKTVIVKLNEDQDLEFEATAILGRGKEHTKWSPGHIYYKREPKINIDNRKIKNPEVVKESCPVGVFEVKKDKLKVNKDNLYKCHVCEACTDVSEGVTLEDNDEDYIFYIESWGQLPPEEIFDKSIDLIKEKLDEFKDLI